MEKENILNFIEDKNIELRENWYFHSTKKDIKTIKNS